MKNLRWGLVVFLLALCLGTMGQAEGELPKDFSQTLQTLYGNESVLSASVCGNHGAAVIRKEAGCILSVLSRQGEGWQVQFENAHAVGEKTTVYLDTEDVLLLTNPFAWGSGLHEQYYFRLEDGEWELSSVISSYSGENSGEDQLTEEYCASLSDGMLYRELLYTDQNGNVLTRRNRGALPDVLTDEERKLSAFDGYEPAVNGWGYHTDDGGDISQPMLQRLFQRVIAGNYVYVDGILTDDGLEFIADKPDGTRVLLCVSYSGVTVPGNVTESTPLPAGTVIGIENFTHTLNLGLSRSGANIGKNPNGTWGVTGVSTRNGDWFEMGFWGVIREGGYWWLNVSSGLGNTPWSDITQMDWSSLPGSLEEAVSKINTAGWATPNNPNPQDRLHLREFPDKNSASLGKYYNGAPLQVLGREGEWTHVRIGCQVGYMMTKYLLFGDGIHKQNIALPSLVSREPLTEIIWDDTLLPEKLVPSEVGQLAVIGAVGEKWYILWEPNTGRTGRILQSALWEGNG